MLEPHDFAAIPVTQDDGTTQPLGVAESKAIYAAMQQSGYLDKHGVIQDTMRTALAEHRLQLPLTAEPQRAAIEHIAKKAAGKLAVRKKENRQTLHLRKGVLLSPAFQELWERIKWKTTYHVAFDSKRLVDEIARRIADELTVPAPKLMLSMALLSVSEASIEATETGYVNRGRIQSAAPLPDIVTYLQNETNLTRKSIVDALIASRRLHLFRKNPQVFMDGVAKIMRDVMQGMIVDGIKYTKIGDDSFYAQELFEKEELTGYLEQNMIESRHSLYNYVVYDSDNEKGFAQAFEHNEAIELYAKLPDWFKIDTPLGSYNPDWAVVVKDDAGEKRLYLIVETKGNIAENALRPTESGKIKCGQAHFQALGEDVDFKKTSNFHDLMEEIGEDA